MSTTSPSEMMGTKDKPSLSKKSPYQSRQESINESLSTIENLYDSTASWDLSALKAVFAQESSTDIGNDWENIDDLMPETSADEKLIVDSVSDLQKLQINLAVSHSKRVRDGKERVTINSDLRKAAELDGFPTEFSDKMLNENLKKYDFTTPFLVNLTRAMEEHKYHEERRKNSESAEGKKGSFIKSNSNGSKQPITPLLRLSKLLNQGKTIESPLPQGNVLQSFTNKTRIIDVEISVDGTRKVVKAYKDGVNILLPCSGRNCTKHPAGHGPNGNANNADDDGDGGVFGALPSRCPPNPAQQTSSEDTSTTPLIMNVTSLALKRPGPQLGTGLSPLASQVPSPRGRKSPLVVNYGPPPPKTASKSASSIVLNTSGVGTSRLNSLLNKPVQNSTANQLKKKQFTTPEPQPMPIILIPSNNANRRKTNPKEVTTDHPVCSWIPILPKGQQRVMASSTLSPAIPIISPSQPETAQYVTQNVRTLIQTMTMSSVSVPRIDKVFSRAAPTRLEEPEPESINDYNPANETAVQEIIEPEADSQFLIMDLEEPADSNFEDEEEGGSDIRLSHSIFESSVNDEDEDEEEQPGYEDDVIVPKIMSTSGAAPTQKVVPEEKLLIAQQQHQLRMSMTAATIAEKARYPIKKMTSDGSELLGCRTCGKSFPIACQAMYRNHMLTKHAVKIDGDEVVSKFPGASNSEWYKCQTCDQLMTSGDKVTHKAACCPQMTEDEAFEIFQISSKASTAMPLFCGLCDKAFDSRIGLRQHITGFHKELAQKIILDPNMRCSSCLQRFEDSVQLTVHCSTCTTRRASQRTMLELARGMLECEICSRPKAHNTIHETQQCYLKTGLIRCLLCHNTVVSRGNFFHHMKTYHYRSIVGISCPFCTAGEMPIKECFTHILDDHYTPVLAQEKRGLP